MERARYNFSQEHSEVVRVSDITRLKERWSNSLEASSLAVKNSGNRER